LSGEKPLFFGVKGLIFDGFCDSLKKSCWGKILQNTKGGTEW